nr:hypothetical protein GCM10020093_059640 [Planobispora longispora]
MIGVGASDREGRPAPFSSGNLSVLVSAPGVEVPVVTPGGEYDLSDGTSSATALVAGAATLIKAKYPDIPPHLVARALSSTARFATKAGYDEHIGFGVVDAAAALDRAGSCCPPRPRSRWPRAVVSAAGRCPRGRTGPVPTRSACGCTAPA